MISFTYGCTSRSENAISNLRQLYEKDLGGSYIFEIVTVPEYPQFAAEVKIFAAPTAIKMMPPLFE
jgi:hypothetical protein